ncbi:MAG: glycosyltransferase family 2 protein [Bacteroidales bacterium]|nr:glycosyltransferase family 2 protein [Bacteroidales bacterium]
MVYIAYIVIAFTAIQLIVALVNFAFKQNMKPSNINNSMVSVLIPARNEEHNILNLLNDLSVQDYHNYEVLVYDDQSTDRTAEIVANFIKKDKKVRLIASNGLPNGWLGKNNACHSLTMEAKGDHLLFLDADVRIKHNIIGKTVSFAHKNDFNLISIFPKQIIKNMGEFATVPIINYILLSLLPLILVQKIGLPSLSAANGQYMFFDAKNYMRFLPHQAMKAEKVEDIKIARNYKQNKLKVACLANEKDIKCRMYESYSESLNGFSKNVTAYFGGSTVVAILFWMVTTFGFIPILLVYGTKWLAIYIAAILFIRILVSLISNQSATKNIIYMLPQLFSLGVIILKSIENRLRKEHIWKGRNVIQ